ncbi:MAG: hypothetical protein ACFE9C_08440 [Candidatus Hodarchaeota archaeon]
MTESKEIIVPEYKEFLYVFHKEEIKDKPKVILSYIPFTNRKITSAKISTSKKEVDIIEKNRELKRWKQSFSYHSLHPEKFKFGFKDLK